MRLLGNQYSKILSGRWFFSTSNFKQIRKYSVPELPQITFPVRGQSQNQQQFPKKLLYQAQNYQHHDKPPRCNYFALEHKARIYHVFNAYNYPMGRMIHRIANLIRGRYSPHYKNTQVNIQNGDICVIVNASNPLLTGKKLLFKQLKYHTGFIGHLKSFSYKYVLNRKPQLLYYYLLRKSMPKTKLSQQYLLNLKIYRGNTHDLSFLPQFAPDYNIYEYAPQINMKEILQKDPNLKLVQGDKDLSQKILNRKVEDAPDNDTTFKEVQKKKMVPNISAKQYQKQLNKQKRYQQRHKVVRAPYKNKYKGDKGFLYFDDQRIAKKTPYYQELANEDEIQDEQEIIPDIYQRKIDPTLIPKPSPKSSDDQPANPKKK